MDTSLNALLAVIDGAYKARVDQIPEGWFTRDQIAQAWGISESQCSAKIKEAHKKGVLDVQKFRIETGRGVYPVPHYRIK